MRAPVADVRTGSSQDRTAPLETRVAGIFAFWPLLAQLGFDELVRQAGYPGSDMVPATSALLSLLALKLIDKERHSHISDLNFDEALGLFAGLNVLPKTTFATDYSYRTVRENQQQLLAGWISRLLPRLDPEPDAFSLDFHSIPHRGDDNGLENHYVPMRGKAVPSILTFFAQAVKSRLLCYSDATIVRDQAAGQLLKFVEFCRTILGADPAWVYFDSRLTTYAEMSRINARGKTSFLTIRRRGSRILRGLAAHPASDWHRAVIDTPHRRHRNIRYLEQTIRVADYEGQIRQIAVTGLGRDQPTLFLTNNFTETPRQLIARYTNRNGIEDSLGSSVNFFHLDCLASEVPLNADLDAALTVLANGCYRWLASELHGFTEAKPKRLCRKIIETGGTVRITEKQIHVHFQKRAYNPILRQAALDAKAGVIPWAGGKTLRFTYAGTG
ncbi:MAG TPA: hypothetical protein VFS35_00550 [Terrimicrobiaceae bacterium]|nr:hypothetical protein [Terrimicrobiaceae bacterium]